MKKIEVLIREEMLDSNEEFQAVYQEYLQTKSERKAGRETFREAKKNYRDAIARGERNSSRLAELQLMLRREKFHTRFLRESFRLSRHRLNQWADDFLKNLDRKHPDVQVSQEKSREGESGKPKSSKKTSAQKPKIEKLVSAKVKAVKKSEPVAENDVKTGKQRLAKVKTGNDQHASDTTQRGKSGK